MELHERIAARRKELEITADTIAEQLGVSRATVYRYESAYIEKIPAVTLERLAGILQTTSAYLMGKSDNHVDNCISDMGDIPPKRAIPHSPLTAEEIAQLQAFLDEEQTEGSADEIARAKNSIRLGLWSLSHSDDNISAPDVAKKEPPTDITTEEAVEIIAKNEFGVNPSPEQVSRLKLAIRIVVEQERMTNN